MSGNEKKKKIENGMQKIEIKTKKITLNLCTLVTKKSL